jgi:hypothetical protein
VVCTSRDRAGERDGALATPAGTGPEAELSPSAGRAAGAPTGPPIYMDNLVGVGGQGQPALPGDPSGREPPSGACPPCPGGPREPRQGAGQPAGADPGPRPEWGGPGRRIPVESRNPVAAFTPFPNTPSRRRRHGHRPSAPRSPRAAPAARSPYSTRSAGKRGSAGSVGSVPVAAGRCAASGPDAVRGPSQNIRVRRAGGRLEGRQKHGPSAHREGSWRGLEARAPCRGSNRAPQRAPEVGVLSAPTRGRKRVGSSPGRHDRECPCLGRLGLSRGECRGGGRPVD